MTNKVKEYLLSHAIEKVESARFELDTGVIEFSDRGTLYEPGTITTVLSTLDSALSALLRMETDNGTS